MPQAAHCAVNEATGEQKLVHLLLIPVDQGSLSPLTRAER